MKSDYIRFLPGVLAVFLLLVAMLHGNAEAANKNTPAQKTSHWKKGQKSPGKSPARKARRQDAVLSTELFVDGRMNLGSASALVLDQMEGTVILEKNASTVTPIASITKLMTAIVLLDTPYLDMEEIIQITSEDIDRLRGSGSRLPVGLSLSRDTALLLALMSSENRAANALARHYPGGRIAFVAAMNRKARELGLRSTYFVEPTGLSPHNVSSAHDLARLVMVAHQYPKIREYSTMATVDLDLGERVLAFKNTNALVENPAWQIGVSKTGYISEAGRCLVMQTWVAEKPVVIVLLDSTGKMTRVSDAARIKRWMESGNNTMLHSTGA